MNYDKIDRTFAWVKKTRPTGFSEKKQERGSSLSDRSINKYKFELHTMYNYMEDKWGVIDFTRLKAKDYFEYAEERIKEYKEGNKSVAYHLRALDDAMHAMNKYGMESGVLSYKLKFPKKENWSEKLSSEKVYRKAADTTIMSASRKEVSAVCDYLRKEVGTNSAKAAADVLWGEFVSGRRISAQLRHKVKDYDDTEGTLTSIGDKGGKTNFGYLTEEAKEHYNKLCYDSYGNRKSPGTAIINVKYSRGDREGEDKAIEKARVQLSNLIKSASDILVERGVIKNPVTSHGARKGFAQEYAESKIKYSTKESLQKELDELVANDKKLKGKVDTVMKNIRGKFTNKEKAAEREFTKKELVALLTSIQINHSRIDVMRYYLTKDFWSSMKQKYPKRI